MEKDTTYVALDTHKAAIAVSVAAPGRRGEVRYLGEIPSRPDAVRKLIDKLARRHRKLSFCYEAGPCGYGLYRQIKALGHECAVIAPSLVPTRPGEHVKTDRRDATTLAKLHRAGELTAIWVPDETHEAMRDLSRARQTAMEVLRRARQHLLSFLLRHGRVFADRKHWTKAHRRWLSAQNFDHPAQQIVLQELIQAIEEAEARRDRLTVQMEELTPNWSLAPLVKAIQAMRGVAQLSAMTLVAEIGDFRRFANPRQLMAYLGLVPSERSSGPKTNRGSITKAGNSRARRVLVEGAWTYRQVPRVGMAIHDRSLNLPKPIRDIAWKAQLRLCARYRRLAARGKPKNVVTVAIAREMAAFIWAIATTCDLSTVHA